MDTRYFYYYTELELILKQFKENISKDNAFSLMEQSVSTSKDKFTNDIKQIAQELPITRSNNYCDSNEFYISVKQAQAQKALEESLSRAYQTIEDRMTTTQKAQYLAEETWEGFILNCKNPYSKTARKACTVGGAMRHTALAMGAGYLTLKTGGIGGGLVFRLALSSLISEITHNWIEDEFASSEFKLAIQKESTLHFTTNLVASIFAGGMNAKKIKDMVSLIKGYEFSHAIPARTFNKIGIEGRKGLANSIWNGNFVPQFFHGATDPFAYHARFETGAKLYPSAIRMLGRTPVSWHNAISTSLVDGVPVAIDSFGRAVADKCHEQKIERIN